jgi:hypothetical protein
VQWRRRGGGTGRGSVEAAWRRRRTWRGGGGVEAAAKKFGNLPASKWKRMPTLSCFLDPPTFIPREDLKGLLVIEPPLQIFFS